MTARELPVYLVSHCRSCGLPARLKFLNVQTASPQPRAGAPWSCPQCGAANSLPAVGVVEAVSKM